MSNLDDNNAALAPVPTLSTHRHATAAEPLLKERIHALELVVAQIGSSFLETNASLSELVVAGSRFRNAVNANLEPGSRIPHSAVQEIAEADAIFEALLEKHIR